MEATLAAFRERLEQPWLVEGQGDFLAAFESYQRKYNDTRCAQVIQQDSPLPYLAETFASIALHCPTFLANPAWRDNELEQLKQLDPWSASSDYMRHIMIPTGGTGGEIKFAMHTWETLNAAVQGYATFYHQPVINSWCTLPFYHVSGCMQAVRTFATGGQLVCADYRDLGAYPEIDRSTYHLSLVPTQLRRILAMHQGEEWLRGFGLILIGGAGMPDELLAQARAAQLPLSCSYGMTETAAVAAAQRPADFLAGKPLAGNPLPHVTFSITHNEIIVRADSLFRGYFPDMPTPCASHATGDQGKLNPAGQLIVLGRLDRLINSGGEKIDPQQVEAAVRELAPTVEVLVVGEPDPEWGQRVVALVANATPEEIARLTTALRERLAPHQQPKRWLPVESLPLKPNGKIDRNQLDAYLAGS